MLSREEDRETYHRPNIRVWHGVELMEVKLVFGADVDVGAPVLRHVAVFGRGENYKKTSAL